MNNLGYKQEIENVKRLRQIPIYLMMDFFLFQLWYFIWDWMCNGPRNVYFDAQSVFQTETRGGGDDSIDWNRMRNCYFLQRLSVRNGVSR